MDKTKPQKPCFGGDNDDYYKIKNSYFTTV